jgi:hypothetical protein
MALEQNPVMTLYPFDISFNLGEVRFSLDNDRGSLYGPINLIDELVMQHLAELGHPETTNPLHLLPSEADKLRNSITSDKKWQDAATEILRTNSSNPDEIDLSEMLGKITRPWFNEALVYYGGAQRQREILKINSSARHSYFTHFTDQLVPTGQNQVPLSVVGIPVLDDMVIMGYRGGHNY